MEKDKGFNEGIPPNYLMKYETKNLSSGNDVNSAARNYLYIVVVEFKHNNACYFLESQRGF